MLGLPRGGVPVAAEIARVLHLPLDVIVVRKLGVPGRAELAMGAVGEGGVTVLNHRVLSAAGVLPEELARVAERERAAVERRVRELRGGRPAAPIAGRIAVVVDDGIATGATARAACQVARAREAGYVVLAAPVAPPDVALSASDAADEVVVLQTPASFSAVGEWYVDFTPTTDDEVIRLLHEA